MKHLPRSVESAPVIEEDDGYEYVLLPITNGVPTLSPALLREVVVGVARVADLDVDKIVTPETMGIHVAAAVSLEVDVPLVVVRGREYGLEGEVAITSSSDHADGTMYVNDVSAGDRVLVLDDLCSTGGSLAALAAALDDVGATVVDTVVVARRVDSDEASEAPADVTALVDVEVRNGAATAVRAYDDAR